jgi:cytoskeletal protein CcmA (bactofilin family)
MIDKKNSIESLSDKDSISIGVGVTFVGSITANGKAYINGKVTGEIFVDQLHVGTTGILSGVIKSREMEIQGEVHDDISCSERLFINSTGLVNGKLTYGELEVKKGGRFTGSMGLTNSHNLLGTNE